jgi:hypothetical protein
VRLADRCFLIPDRSGHLLRHARRHPGRRARRVAPVDAGRHADQVGEAAAEGAQRRADRETDLERARIGAEGAGHSKAGTSLKIMKVSTLPDPWRTRACPAILADQPALGPVLRAAARPWHLPSRPSTGLPPAPRRRPDRVRQARPSPGVWLRLPQDRRPHLLSDHHPRPPRPVDHRGDLRHPGTAGPGAYDRMVGLDLADLAVDGRSTKAPAAAMPPAAARSTAASKAANAPR